jgi:threonine/homoserine/homoserine lactone efflux protein
LVIFLGLIIGFLSAVPLGPINFFVFSQALRHNFLRSFLAGLTASLLDFTYCLLAIIGISQIQSFLSRFNVVFKLIGAAILAAIAVRLIKQSKTLELTSLSTTYSNAYARPMIITFFLYVSNPTLYAFWIAIASTALAYQWVLINTNQPLIFALCCGLGSASWYLLLTRSVSKFQNSFKPAAFRKVLIGLAVLLFGFAAYNLITLIL